jgi:hypothetical protein
MTDVPIRDYVDRAVDFLQAEIDRREASRTRAVEKAEEDINRRLSAMNEFRAAMADQAGRMVTRDAADKQHAALADRLDKIEAAVDRQRGRQAAYAAIITITGVIVSIAVLIVTHVHF